jgi:adenosylcobinamide-GDP ribazoletransferase
MFEDDRQTDAPPPDSLSAEEWTQDLKAATGFLSRLPVRTGDFSVSDLRRAARAFPLVGAGIGFLAAVLLLICLAIDMSAPLASAFAVASLSIMTGALHEDGLSDTADGFFGSADRNGKLKIMRDSASGTFGVLSLIFAVIAKIAALAQIIAVGAVEAAAALVAAETISRHGMVILMTSTPQARSDGVAVMAGQPFSQAARTSLFISLAIGLPTLWLTAGMQGIAVAGGLAVLAFFGVKELAKRHIGGHTGDVCGAVQQLVAIAVLVGLAIAAGD